MDDLVQSVAMEAISNPDVSNNVFWGGVGIGILIAIQVMDKLAHWFRPGKVKGGSAVDNVDIKALTDAINKLTEETQTHNNSQARQSEQVDDLFDWHAPDGEGEQKWKGAAMFRKLCNIEGSLKSWFHDGASDMKEFIGILRAHIKDDAEAQHKMSNQLHAIERKVTR